MQHTSATNTPTNTIAAVLTVSVNDLLDCTTVSKYQSDEFVIKVTLFESETLASVICVDMLGVVKLQAIMPVLCIYIPYFVRTCGCLQ